MAVDVAAQQFRRNSGGTPQIASTNQNLPILPAPFRLAEKMATRLVTGQILL
jgi:hypothetical protein